MTERLTEQIANRVYDLLVQHCGATSGEFWRENFVHCQVHDECREYRFQGALGFGGKFWKNGEKWYVSCYREDETPERLAMIARPNEALAALRKEATA